MSRLVLKDHIRVENDCHRWTGVHDHAGYGRAGKDLAHRRAYEEAYGPIPDGLQIDHLCGIRDCINPLHLEAVTPRENTLRSGNPAAINARKTHCIRGHEFNEENTRTDDDGSRTCRVCDAARKRASCIPTNRPSTANRARGRRRPAARPPNKSPRR
jgi:hypothetical protein